MTGGKIRCTCLSQFLKVLRIITSSVYIVIEIFWICFQLVEETICTCMLEEWSI